MRKLDLTQKTAIALYLMSAVVLSSCESQQQQQQNVNLEIKYKSKTCDINVVEIDSCQYIIAQTGYGNGGISIIHKFNCKNSYHNCK